MKKTIFTPTIVLICLYSICMLNACFVDKRCFEKSTKQLVQQSVNSKNNINEVYCNFDMWFNTLASYRHKVDTLKFPQQVVDSAKNELLLFFDKWNHSTVKTKSEKEMYTAVNNYLKKYINYAVSLKNNKRPHIKNLWN